MPSKLKNNPEKDLTPMALMGAFRGLTAAANPPHFGEVIMAAGFDAE